MIQVYFNELYITNSHIVKCRIASMMCYYSDGIYPHTGSMFANAITFLINGLCSKREERAFALQCNDSLR